MNDKNIKKLLKEKANQTEIKDFTNEILSSAHHTVKVTEKAPVKRKKLTISIISAVASCCLVIVFVVLGVTNFISSGGNVQNIEQKKQQVFSREIFALGNVINNINSGENLNITYNKEKNLNIISLYDEDERENEEIEGEEGEENLTEEERIKIAKDVNYYLLTGNAFMEKHNIKTTEEQNTDTNYSEYQLKLIVSYKDNKGFETEYICYYNTKTENDTEEIKGIILSGKEKHNIEGEITTKDDEVETELKIIFSSTTYISIENETETGENEYEYKFFTEGKLVKKVEMEVSNENGERELEIEVTFNGITESYSFEYSDNEIQCEYELNNIQTEIIIEINTDYYLYKFESGEVKMPKNLKNTISKVAKNSLVVTL